MAKKKQTKVVAVTAFADTLTTRDYQPGQEVTGWDDERVKHYMDRGLVALETVEEPKPETKTEPPAGPEETPEKAKAGPEETPERKAGPEEKPGVGPAEKK